jgi:hypothetical protein
MKFIAARLRFEPRDLWVGVYWNRTGGVYGSCYLDVYICVIPMLPLRLVFRTRQLVLGKED